MDSGVLDEALERFARTGPEFGPGLSNHGPMAAEALLRLGRADAVLPWSGRYAARLGERPRATGAFTADYWREALGDVRRVEDWTRFFRRELETAPWTEVTGRWAARLAPGMMAGATHGPIRTAHAARALAEAETPPRREELANALAYWAARYQPLPGSPSVPGSRRPAEEALRQVARVNPAGVERPGLIFEAVRGLDSVPRFAGVVDLAGPDGDVDAFLSGLMRTFARVLLANPRSPIPFVHGVTAPRAVRVLLPYLEPEAAVLAARHAWQTCAALYAWYGDAPPDQQPGAVEAVGRTDWDDLVARAVATGDEHAIKFAEACREEDGCTPDPVLARAAARVVEALG